MLWLQRTYLVRLRGAPGEILPNSHTHTLRRAVPRMLLRRPSGRGRPRNPPSGGLRSWSGDTPAAESACTYWQRTPQRGLRTWESLFAAPRSSLSSVTLTGGSSGPSASGARPCFLRWNRCRMVMMKTYPPLTRGQTRQVEQWFEALWRKMCENDSRLRDIRARCASLTE